MPNFKVKHQIKRLLMTILITSLIVPYIYANGVVYGKESEDKKYVTVCVEKRTLGQGYLIEPTRVECQEGDTAASVTLRLLETLGYEYEYSGSVEERTFYLSAIKDTENKVVDIPSYITDNGGPSNDGNDGNNDEYLGEFDYCSMSGWMITVDHEMIHVGSAAYDISGGECIRWAFTLYGYGADLGYITEWGNEAYYTEADKGDLIRELAVVRDNPDFLSTNNNAYQSAYHVALSTTATQDEVLNATKQLVIAYDEFMNSSETPTKSPLKTLPYTIEDVVNKTSEFMLATVTNPICGSVGGEWAVLQLARSGMITEQFKNTYLTNLTAYVKEKDGVLHKRKLTEYSRVIIALSAIGENPADFAGYNLLQPLANYENTVWQGINGAIYALIAFDTGNYEIPTIQGSGTQTTRENLIQYILDNEIDGGGWALSGETPDPDITMMAIQGLAKYYNTNETVKEAVERGLTAISEQQQEDGGLSSWETKNSESVAQTICALCALNIDPATDERFITEDGSWLLSNLYTYLVEKDGMFSFAHTGSTYDQMATEQAGYALVAYDRFLKNKKGLYDMSDVQVDSPAITSQEATLIVPSNLDNRKGSEFNITLRLGSITEAATMIDGVILYNPNLEVVSVTTESTILGGALNWNADDGALRFVYMDILNGGEITSTQEGLQDFVHVTFKIREPFSTEDKLSFTLSSCRQMKDSEAIISYIDLTPVHEITLNSLDIAATILYQGDGSDWIPANKKAVKVTITGLSEMNTGLGFQSEHNTYSKLYYSNDFSTYSGVTTYIMLVDSATTMEELIDSQNYYSYTSEPLESINFADTNKDSVIDAQDALNMVSLWLRKSTVEVNSELILTYNVTGDSKIDSIDALAVVEYFVKLKPFAIRLK